MHSMSQVTNHNMSTKASSTIDAASSATGAPFRLRTYQLEGVRFLRNNSFALLADEMGLGKSVQTAIALDSGRREYRRVLLVAPTSLCLNWQRELEKWAPTLPVRRVLGSIEDRDYTYRLPVPVLIASYEQVRRDSQRFHGVVEFDLVVLDEAQRIKNRNSETSLACRIIPRKRSWALTGTPLENHPSDLIGIFRFLKPRLLRDGMSRKQIHASMAGHYLRRTKSEVLKELPPILTREIRLELGSGQRRNYDKAWNTRHESFDGLQPKEMVNNMLALITRLKQICNFDDESGESVKLDVVRSILGPIQSASGKVLIFSQYVKTLEKLSGQIDIAHDIFHGGLSIDARERVLRTFREQPGPRALLLSLHAGGVGLNLQEASTVILFDRWWNPAVEDQAVQRAHRFGRQEPLEVIRFMVEGSIEQRIDEILNEKRILFDDYVGANSQPSLEQSHRLKQILELH